MTAAIASLPVTDEWRRAIIDRLDELGMNRSDRARAVSTSTTTISMLLTGRQPRSVLVPAIERAVKWTAPAIMPVVTLPPPALTVMPDPQVVAIAELRAARDAIDADIVAHETVRACVEERLAEAYQARRARRGDPPAAGSRGVMTR